MPFVLLGVAMLAWPFFLIRWLARSRIVTAKRLVVPWILAMLATIDYCLVAPIYLVPRLLFPFRHPAITGGWNGLVQYLGRAGGEQWYRSTTWLFQARPPGFWVVQAPFIVLAIYLIHWAYRSGWPATREPQAARVGTHGSSRWRGDGELKSTLKSVETGKPGSAGVVVGSNGRRAWATNPKIGNPHILLIGASRSGKSRRVVLPTIWTLASARESMVLTDPKGELYAATSAELRRQGYDVILIDLLEPWRGNQWNPLAKIAQAKERGAADEAASLAWTLGNTLAWAAQGKAESPFWSQTTEALIASLAIAVAFEAPKGARHPASLYHLLTEYGVDKGEPMDRYFQGLDDRHPARKAYGTVLLSDSRTRASIATSTAANLRLFSDPAVAWLTAKSDHEPAQAGTKPTAIFLLLPDEDRTRRVVANLYISQLYRDLTGVARRNGGALPVPVWFLLDEFANVGRLPDMIEKLTVSAGRNIRFLLAVQDLAQITAVYSKEDAGVIGGNCDTWLFLRTNEPETAKIISAKVGNYTVRTTTLQRRPVGPNSASESATGRPLVTPDEVLRWPVGTSLLMQAGEFSARLPLADLSVWKKAAQAFRPDQGGGKEAKMEPPSLWLPGDDGGGAAGFEDPGPGPGSEGDPWGYLSDTGDPSPGGTTKRGRFAQFK